jgi:hypothetical protein
MKELSIFDKNILILLRGAAGKAVLKSTKNLSHNGCKKITLHLTYSILLQ